MSSAASSTVINETPESRYSNIIDGTPFSGDNGVSFLAFNEMTETGLLGLLGLYPTLSAGKKANLLALKAELSRQQDYSNKRSRLHIAQRVHRFFSRSHDSSVQLSQPHNCLFCGESNTELNRLHKCHILQLKDLNDNSAEEFNELYELLENWEDIRHWRRSFVVSHEMNMIYLCPHHNRDFDHYKFSLIVNPLNRKVSFISLSAEYDDDIISTANDRIHDLDLSHLSNRAISMRMEKALKSGCIFPGTSGVDYVGWQTLRDFSIDSSERSDDSDDEEASQTYKKKSKNVE